MLTIHAGHIAAFWAMSTLIATMLPTLLRAADQDQIRRELEATYIRMFESMRTAKSMDDLDAQNQRFETPDWVSIQPGRKPLTWKEMRAFGFEALTSGPKDAMSFPVDQFQMPDGNTAVLEGTMRISGLITDQRGQFGTKGAKVRVEASAPIRDTWIRMDGGWRRKIHQKLAPNKILIDGKEVPSPATAAPPQAPKQNQGANQPPP